VITEGAHIATKSEVTKKWSAVNDAFFDQNEARLWKDELYKKGDFRKIRDKFKQTMTSTKADIDTANQSGRSGDLGPQFQLVKQIMDEIEENEEEEIERKKKEDNTKKKLNEIEEKAQSNRPNPLKKRDLDGAITDSSDPNKKKKESLHPRLKMPLLSSSPSMLEPLSSMHSSGKLSNGKSLHKSTFLNSKNILQSLAEKE
jgi:hypothetical protein